MARHPTTSASQSDGLSGPWISREELAQIDIFRSDKRAFKVKLNTNFGAVPDRDEPGIKAAVRREYQAGDIICRAGEYGSTAFLLLEGGATAFVPETAAPAPIRGRRRLALRRMRGLFRKLAGPQDPKPGRVDVGEVSRYASIHCDRPPPPRLLRPGDLFGIDTCLNFYPREATVRADERCVVIEMLRSVLDSLREAGGGGDRIDADYAADAIRIQLHLSSLLRAATDEEIESVASSAELQTSRSLPSEVLYHAGDSADRVYLVRSGTVRLTRGDATLAYLGRGATFGLEGIADLGSARALQLRCVSHPQQFSPIEVGRGLTLGRSPSCEVAFPAEERSIGRQHCRLEERGGELFLVDLGSASYTLLNGDRCRESLVTAGDQITVVDYTFELVRPSATAAVGPTLRTTSAVGLDSFEVVAIPNDSLRRLAGSNPQLGATMNAIARQVRAAIHPPPAQQARTAQLVELNLHNSQNTLLIDLDRCTRCDQCVRACASAHDGVARFTRDGPRFGNYLVTMACRSCTDPQCMIGCPVGSIRRQDSLEIRIEDWCIGCERCANQCPFGNINMVELGGAKSAAPAEAQVPQLRATVCDLCAGYAEPNCVYACPHEAAIRVNPTSFFSDRE